MPRHRFLQYLSTPLPQPRPGPVNLSAFCFCPVALVTDGSHQQALYQAAFEHARALVRPSPTERDLLGVWN